MDKSPDAFRTISEVADWLGTPTHVLRFWESRFTQVKPVKRAGGRRYYRPKDMELLGGIKRLLHGDGMTIRGVQKLLRKEGVRHVAEMSPPVNLSNVIEATADEAGIELNASPAPVENVIPIKDPARMSAPAGKPAEPVADIPFDEPDRPPASNDQATPDQTPAKATPDATDQAAAAPEPILAKVPEDPSDSDDDGSDIIGVAAALRGISEFGKPLSTKPEILKELYDRLVHLKQTMAEQPPSKSAD
ncbi:MAG: MerR family transcriptional regulator [Paracoccaceae bacterium]